jgi:hypothetical protein
VDVDTFIFDTQGGRIHFTAQGIGAGQNLRAHFEVWASDTKLGESPVLYGELNAALTLNLPAGTYTVKVMGSTEYGNYGKYTLSVQKESIIDVTGAFQTRIAIAPDQLQARLVELDQAIAQGQEDLQGALNLQAQYTAERDQVEADIVAATELSAGEAAPNLADLQANQAQIMTALDQNQEQITQLQTQLDQFTTEQTLIGTTLADADAAQVRQANDFTGVIFSLTSLDSGDVHQLQIQEQSNYLPAVDSVRQQYPGRVVTNTVRGGGVSDAMAGDQAVAGDQSVVQTTQVTDFTTATFSLSEENGLTHQLQITDQTAQPDGTATFDGMWDGQSVTGTLAYDDAGNVHITAIFRDDSSVVGTLSGQPGAYHFEGMMTPADGSSPVPITGDQDATPATPVTDFTSVAFAMSDEVGTAHQLQITDQTAQPDGTAAFNGVWDGQSVAGTLAYDAAGNVHVLFSGDNGTCDATIAGNPGAFQIDGSLTMPGGDTLTVTGSQIA